MKRAIVTGATGFIGSQLVKELISNNYEVLAIIRENSCNFNRLNKLQGLEVISCNLANLDKICNYTDKSYDYFFHMAWDSVSGKLQSDYDIQLSNVKTSLLAMEVAKRMGCKRFISAGSIHETECKIEMNNNEQITNQGNAYKIAKLTAHYYCKLNASKLGIDFLWPLLTNTYGVGELSSRLINTVIRKLLDGIEPELTQADQLYDFIYITDAAKAYRYIAERGVSYENYIIGSGNIKPLKEYLLDIKKIINPGMSLGFGKYEYKGVYLSKEDLSSEQLYNDTGFSVEVSFSEGIKKTMEWLLKVKN